MTQLILASQSPRRKTLLQKLGIPFEIQPARINEYSLTTDPTILVKELSLSKAKNIAMNPSPSIYRCLPSVCR